MSPLLLPCGRGIVLYDNLGIITYFIQEVLVMAETKKAERLPNKFEACLPVLVLLGLMVANSVLEWGNDPHLYITD